jgi:twitching motility protein PilT
MPNLLTEQDTLFGTIAYRNKFITADQLSEAVQAIQEGASGRLGDILLQKGFMIQEQVNVVLEVQGEQRKVLQQQKRPEPRPAPPVPPKPTPTVAAPAAAPPPSAPEPSPPDTAETVVAEAPPAAAAPVAPPLRTAPAEFKDLYDYLTYTRAAHASDLHISAAVRPFLRRFGQIQQIDVSPLEPAETERLLFSVLSDRQKAFLVENRSLEFCLDVPGEGRYRATVIKQRHGWDGVFHVIRREPPSFEELGLPECLKRLTEYQQGLALITGAGNSGKTTTLAALLDLINASRSDHIITVENPVEYVHQPKQCQVTQREVGVHTKSYATALRAALREDPDIIMVGELRDLETLSMAITASETGHLVLGTLHTTSAATTISRILDGFPVAQQAQVRMMLSESLRGVVSQELVPRKDGNGVALALEILFITSAVSSLIRDNDPFQIPSIMQTQRRMGMCRMDDSLLELVNKGVIDGAEAYLRAANKGPFEAHRKGQKSKAEG